MNKNSKIIRISDLTIIFNESFIFENLNLDLNRGEKVILTGRSGTGKSTLLKALLGYVVPDSGTIHVSGELINAKSVWKLRRKFAYVPQEPDLGSGKVEDFLVQPFTYRCNQDITFNKENVLELFERFLLSNHLFSSNTGDLSGGEKQRVSIISALTLEREILLLDEPTSALDEESKNTVVEYLKRQKHTTSLVITHDHDFNAIADRIIDIEEISGK